MMQRALLYTVAIVGYAITLSHCLIANSITLRPTIYRSYHYAETSLTESTNNVIEFESKKRYKGGVDGIEILKELSRTIQLSQTHSMKLLPYFEDSSVFIDANFCPMESISFLRGSCGIKRSQIHEMIKRHPGLTATLLMRIYASNPPLKSSKNIIEEILGDENQISPRLSVIRTASRSDIRSKLQFLCKDSSIKLSSFEVDKLLRKNPELFSYDLRNIKKVINFLQKDVYMSMDELRRVVTKSPVVLSYSVEQNLTPTVKYFQSDGIRFRLQEIRSMIGVYPPFLYYSDQSQLERVRLLFEDIFDDSDDILRISMSEPIVWGLPTDELKARIVFLVESMHLDLEELQMILTSFPKLFTLQVETNLKPTIEFLLRQMSRSDLRDYVMECPSVLACSLESRLRPRSNKLNEIGYDSICDTPAYVMLLNDQRFREWIEKTLNL